MSDVPACRLTGAPLDHVLVDLGMSPLANAFLRADQLTRMEPFYPLQVRIGTGSLLAQLPATVDAASIFSDYVYFSSFSESWLRHAEQYVEAICERLVLGPHSRVVELASNDGYLLQYFVQRGVPALGVEPAANVAIAARERGVDTLVAFFGVATAREMVETGGRADLIIANNVLAHVPDLNDFIGGMSILLAEQGTITIEFPHLARLLAENQFDTIYHEHFSYFTLLSAATALRRHGLEPVDVDELPTHGGSLRLHAQHRAAARARALAEPGFDRRVHELLERERAQGLHDIAGYLDFAPRVAATRRALLRFLIDAREQGRRVVGYGAPAKGNTLLNYCGVKPDLLEFTVDRSPHKQGLFLPGTHIPIRAPEAILEARPDYVLILPWNLRDEVIAQMSAVREWGGRFVVPIPGVEVVG